MLLSFQRIYISILFTIFCLPITSLSSHKYLFFLTSHQKRALLKKEVSCSLVRRNSLSPPSFNFKASFFFRRTLITKKEQNCHSQTLKNNFKENYTDPTAILMDLINFINKTMKSKTEKIQDYTFIYEPIFTFAKNNQNPATLDTFLREFHTLYKNNKRHKEELNHFFYSFVKAGDLQMLETTKNLQILEPLIKNNNDLKKILIEKLIQILETPDPTQTKQLNNISNDKTLILLDTIFADLLSIKTEEQNSFIILLIEKKFQPCFIVNIITKLKKSFKKDLFFKAVKEKCSIENSKSDFIKQIGIFLYSATDLNPIFSYQAICKFIFHKDIFKKCCFENLYVSLAQDKTFITTAIQYFWNQQSFNSIKRFEKFCIKEKYSTFFLYFCIYTFLEQSDITIQKYIHQCTTNQFLYSTIMAECLEFLKDFSLKYLNLPENNFYPTEELQFIKDLLIASDKLFKNKNENENENENNNRLFQSQYKTILLDQNTAFYDFFDTIECMVEETRRKHIDTNVMCDLLDLKKHIQLRINWLNTDSGSSSSSSQLDLQKFLDTVFQNKSMNIPFINEAITAMGKDNLNILSCIEYLLTIEHEYQNTSPLQIKEKKHIICLILLTDYLKNSLTDFDNTFWDELISFVPTQLFEYDDNFLSESSIDKQAYYHLKSLYFLKKLQFLFSINNETPAITLIIKDFLVDIESFLYQNKQYSDFHSIFSTHLETLFQCFSTAYKYGGSVKKINRLQIIKKSLCNYWQKIKNKDGIKKLAKSFWIALRKKLNFTVIKKYLERCYTKTETLPHGEKEDINIKKFDTYKYHLLWPPIKDSQKIYRDIKQKIENLKEKAIDKNMLSQLSENTSIFHSCIDLLIIFNRTVLHRKSIDISLQNKST